MVKGDQKIAIECKASTAPKLTKGFWRALDDVKPQRTYIIAPITDSYPIKESVIVCSLSIFLAITHDN